MSFSRILMAAIAALGLTTAVFAADENTNNTQAPADTTTQATQPSDTQASATSNTENAQAATQTAEETKVDLNKASVKELMKVKGINSSKAKAIVAYRKAHGDFKSLDELKDVKGFKKMSDKAMKKLLDQLTVG